MRGVKGGAEAGYGGHVRRRQFNAGRVHRFPK